MADEDWGQMLEDEEKWQQEQQLSSKVFKIGVCLLYAGLTTQHMHLSTNGLFTVNENTPLFKNAFLLPLVSSN